MATQEKNLPATTDEPTTTNELLEQTMAVDLTRLSVAVRIDGDVFYWNGRGNPDFDLGEPRDRHLALLASTLLQGAHEEVQRQWEAHRNEHRNRT